LKSIGPDPTYLEMLKAIIYAYTDEGDQKTKDHTFFRRLRKALQNNNHSAFPTTLHFLMQNLD